VWYCRYGKSIDGHNIVFRMNQAPTTGYTREVGSKTTHRLLNRVWTLAYANWSVGEKFLRPEAHTMEMGVKLISSRTHVSNFVALSNFARKHYARLNVEVQKLHRATVQQAQKALVSYARCLEKSEIGGKGKKFTGEFNPSSGLVAAFFLHNLCDKITVYGVGIADVDAKVPYQYYHLAGTERGRGNVVHSFKAEMLLFRHLAQKKVLTLCEYSGCTFGRGFPVPFDPYYQVNRREVNEKAKDVALSFERFRRLRDLERAKMRRIVREAESSKST